MFELYYAEKMREFEVSRLDRIVRHEPIGADSPVGAKPVQTPLDRAATLTIQRVVTARRDARQTG